MKLNSNKRIHLMVDVVKMASCLFDCLRRQ